MGGAITLLCPAVGSLVPEHDVALASVCVYQARLLYGAASAGFSATGNSLGELSSRGNLAAMLDALGDTVKAEGEFRAVLAGEIRLRGAQAEETLKCVA